MGKIQIRYLIVFFSVLIIGANVMLGVVLADHSRTSLKMLIDNRMLDIAKSAADLLDGDDLRDLKAEDKGTEAYQRIYDTLAVFQKNIDLKFIYCVRAVGNDQFIFTVDPSPTEASEFGETVVWTNALHTAGTGTPMADEKAYTDSYGRFYSAYCPVFDSSGGVAGIVGVDFDADWYEEQIAVQRRAITVCILFSILMCLSLMWVVMKRTQALEQALKIEDHLNHQLSTIANIYVAMYDVDIERDHFTEMKSTRAYLSRLVKTGQEGARAVLSSLARKVSSEEYREDLIRFADLDTLKERLKGQKIISVEFRTVKMKRWIRARFIVTRRDRDGNATRVFLLAEDINKEKKERDALIDMSERAVAANEAKSEFLSRMSHEIRTPINAMLGMNEMILRESGDEDIRTYSENIRDAGHMLLGLVNDILDFSRIEAGKVKIIPVEYDLSDMLNDQVNMIRGRAEEKGLLFKTEFDENVPRRLFGDEIRIKQVITNILTNAVKYTEKGSVTFSLGFRLCPEDADSVLLRVSIADTGIGIRRENLARLFSEFERIEESRNRNVEGAGLGMTITKSLLEKMGAALQVESRYGEGSRFFFELRQRVMDWEPMGDYQVSRHVMNREQRQYREKFTAPEAQILVADDTPVNLLVFRNLLKQTQVKIDTASGGDEALQLAQSRKYDLIVLDHMMPGKDGIETLHELRARKKGPNADTPVICLTANAIYGAREKYLEAGFDDYLTKPVSPGKLEEVLIAHLPKEKIELTPAEEPETGDDTELPEVLAPLRGQDWIDPALGIRYNGSPEAYLALLKLFYDSMEGTADELEGFYAEENWEEFTIKVHGLKSSARLIGAAAFGEDALLMESAGREGDTEYIRSHFSNFMAGFRKFRAPLSEIFAGKEAAEEKPEADGQRMEEFFEEIFQAAEAMDGDRLEEIVAEMEGYRIPESQKGLYKRLKSAVVQLDYEGIPALLGKNEKKKSP